MTPKIVAYKEIGLDIIISLLSHSQILPLMRQRVSCSGDLELFALVGWLCVHMPTQLC